MTDLLARCWPPEIDIDWPFLNLGRPLAKPAKLLCIKATYFTWPHSPLLLLKSSMSQSRPVTRMTVPLSFCGCPALMAAAIRRMLRPHCGDGPRLRLRTAASLVETFGV